MLDRNGTPLHLKFEPVKKKGQKYPTKWKLACELFTGKFLVYTRKNFPPEIRPIKELTYTREVKRGYIENSREEVEGPPFSRVCEFLKLKPQEKSIISLLEGAFSMMENLNNQYAWRVEDLEKKLAEKEKAASSKKLKEVREANRLRRLKQEKGFVRKVDP